MAEPFNATMGLPGLAGLWGWEQVQTAVLDWSEVWLLVCPTQPSLCRTWIEHALFTSQHMYVGCWYSGGICM